MPQPSSDRPGKGDRPHHPPGEPAEDIEQTLQSDDPSPAHDATADSLASGADQTAAFSTQLPIELQPTVEPADLQSDDFQRHAKPGDLEHETDSMAPDQTVQLTPALARLAAGSSGSTAGQADPQSDDLQSTDRRSEDPGSPARSSDSPQSVMRSRQIDGTISAPQFLSPDAAFWGSVSQPSASASGVSSASGSPSESAVSSDSNVSSSLPPAIERSISETKLNLRGREIAPQQSPPELAATADYRLLRLLGKGGMGNVYAARQGSLDRVVALKVIRPLEGTKRDKLEQKGELERVEKQRRLQFISEAVVTGDLEHPNIIPVHEIAIAGDQTLFYSMRRVSGTPWSQVIADKSRDENLEILLKVSDAVGFAHTRGVVHRDIKPENIMLGEFGVVTVMDWGLALAQPGFEKREAVVQSTGLGGSPAYMAPEMATGPVQRIGPASDIYLLGATLFQIVTGSAPHFGVNVRECLRAVAANEIREVPESHRGELLDVALRAMATQPQDRYPDVRSFQDAIRQYRSHSESIALASKADEDLRRGKTTGNYADFSRSLFGFEEALALWAGNRRAVAGLQRAKLQYAETAYRKAEFDLGLSLLDPGNADHHELIERLEAGRRASQSRHKTMTWLYRGVAALLAFILIGGGISIYAIQKSADEARFAERVAQTNAEFAIRKSREAEDNLELAIARQKEADQSAAKASRKAVEAMQEREKAIASEQKARASEQRAQAAREKAIASAKQARDARDDAEIQRLAAKEQQALADQAREQSDYESYVSRIGLVKARVEQNEFDGARRILNQLKSERGQRRLGWEWRWLSKQTRQSRSEYNTQAGVIDLAINRSARDATARDAIWLLEDGTLFSSSLSPSGDLTGQPINSLQDAPATAVAMSEDSRQVAVANANGSIEIWNPDFSQRIHAFATPAATITALRYTPGGQLLSAANDRTVRLWDPATGDQLAVCWHRGPVVDLAVARRDGPTGKLLLVTAVAESLSGYAACWDLTPPSGEDPPSAAWDATERGAFYGHLGPVFSVAISPAADLAASGDASGECLLWHPDEAQQSDYRSVFSTIANTAKERSASDEDRSADGDDRSTSGPAQRFRRLSDRSRQTLVAAARSPDASDESQTPPAHRDAIRTLTFAPSGDRLLSGADDYTLKLWSVEQGDLLQTLRGHGGWVRRAGFVAGADPATPLVVSGSSDATIRSWDPQQFVSESVEILADEAGTRAKPHQDSIASVRFDATGTLVVSASRDQTARVMRLDKDRQTFSQVALLRADQPDRTVLQEGSSFVALSAALDRLGKRLFVASADAAVRVWDVEDATQVGQLDAVGMNDSLALTPDGRFLLTLSSDPAVNCILWEFPPGTDFSPRIVREFRAHPQAVTALAISADGRVVFSGDRAGLGILWDVADTQGEGRRLEQARGFRINAAAFSQDGADLWFAADDHQLTRVRVESGETLSQFTHQGPVTQLSLSSDDRYAVTLSEQSLADSLITRATLWDLASGDQRLVHGRQRTGEQTPSAEPQSPALRAGTILSASFGSTPTRVILGLQGEPDQPPSVGVWDIASSGAAQPTSGFELPPSQHSLTAAIPLATDAMLTLSGEAAILWDLPSQSHLKSYRTNGALKQANFSADSRFVVTVGASVKVWDLASGRSLAKLESPHDGPVHAAQFSPAAGSSRLVTAGQDGVIRLWNWDASANTINPIRHWQLSGPRRPIRCVVFSADEQWLLAVGDQGVVRLLNTDDEAPASIYDLANGVGLTSAAFRADGNWFAVGGSDAEVRLWPTLAAGETIPRPILLQGHADRVEDVCFLHDGTEELRVLTASRDKSARVWDPRIGSREAIGREILALRRHTLGLTGIDASPDGQSVITSGADAQLVLWPADPQPPAAPADN